MRVLLFNSGSWLGLQVASALRAVDKHAVFVRSQMRSVAKIAEEVRRHECDHVVFVVESKSTAATPAMAAVCAALNEGIHAVVVYQSSDLELGHLFEMPPFAKGALVARVLEAATAGVPNADDWVFQLVNAPDKSAISDTPMPVSVLPSLLPRLAKAIAAKRTGILTLVNDEEVSARQVLQLYKRIVDPQLDAPASVHAEIKVSSSGSGPEPTDGGTTAIALTKAMERYKLHTYEPKVILMTGACGFIGGCVFRRFHRRYPHYKLVSLDNMSYCSNLKNLPPRGDRVVHIEGDICDGKLVNELIEKYKIDTIIHFAAESHVDNSFRDSPAFTRTNIIGTHTLLQATLNHRDQIRRFVHVSTDEVYGETLQEGDGLVEDSILNPTNPYAATKAGAEFLVKSYMHSFGLPCIITRGNNVYGPCQFTEKAIPKFISRLERGLKIELHGDGSALRSFMYVEDTAAAFDTIIHRGSHTIYNIASEIEYSVKDIATRLVRLMKPGDKVEDWVANVKDRAFNDQRYFISGAALNALGWQTTVNIEDGLRMTVDWVEKNHDFWKEKEALVEQSLQAHPDHLIFD